MNVPDDWGCYYHRCPTCGERYHASEGGCSGCCPGCERLLEDCTCEEPEESCECCGEKLEDGQCPACEALEEDDHLQKGETIHRWGDE